MIDGIDGCGTVGSELRTVWEGLMDKTTACQRLRVRAEESLSLEPTAGSMLIIGDNEHACGGWGLVIGTAGDGTRTLSLEFI